MGSRKAEGDIDNEMGTAFLRVLSGIRTSLGEAMMVLLAMSRDVNIAVREMVGMSSGGWLDTPN